VAVTLDRIAGTDPLRTEFEGGELTIVPEACGKKVIDRRE
jgi:tRNA (cytidine56-2'-O)-methyltransferase